MDELRARREERLRESLPFWRESLTNGVLDGAIEHKHGRKYDKLRKLWWHGVPPNMRSTVWSRAMPNNLSITEGLHIPSLPFFFPTSLSPHARRNDGTHTFSLTSTPTTTELFTILTQQAKQTKTVLERSKKAKGKRTLSDSSTCSTASADTPEAPQQQQPQQQTAEQHTEKQQQEGAPAASASATATQDGTPVAAAAAAEEEEEETQKPLGRMDTVQLISFDMPRTFTLLQFFDANGPLYPGLQSVLEAYVVYRPDLGYVQGMSFLASMLLLNLEPPAAFTVLANILNLPVEKAFYGMNVPLIDAYSLAVDAMIAECVPKIGRLFQKYEISSRMFLLEWVMTLYAKALPLDIAAHVWDLFMLEGEIVIFRVAVALVHLFRDELIYATYDQCLTLLNNIPQEILDEALFESIAAVSFSQKKWDAALKKSIVRANELDSA